MLGASGIEVVMKLHTLMMHVTAYGVEWKRRYGLQGSGFYISSYGQSCFFDNMVASYLFVYRFLGLYVFPVTCARRVAGRTSQ